jgi:hypothetical protein
MMAARAPAVSGMTREEYRVNSELSRRGYPSTNAVTSRVTRQIMASATASHRPTRNVMDAPLLSPAWRARSGAVATVPMLAISTPPGTGGPAGC